VEGLVSVDDEGKAVDAELAAALQRKYTEERERRQTKDRGKYLAMQGEFEHYADDPNMEPVPREPRTQKTGVVIIGAGFGGLLMAARLQDEGIHDFLLLDISGDVGGVWYWNRYPGASCDIDAYTYLPLLEETGYMPTQRYAGQREIYAYAQLLARRYGVYERALFHTAANAIAFDDDSGCWEVRTDRGDVLTSDFVVLATGGAYSRPRLPDIPGIETFAGASFHSSRWDYGYTGGAPDEPMVDLADKTMAIIGTGASSLQIVPRVAKDVKKLYVVQRTPSTVGARKNPPTDPEWFQSLEPGWHRRRIENFADLTMGGNVKEDLIQDGWSLIYYDLTIHTEDPDLTPEQRAEALRLADFAKMERLRAASTRSSRTRRRPTSSSPSTATCASGRASTRTTSTRSTAPTSSWWTPAATASTGSRRGAWWSTAWSTRSTASCTPPAS
jgi:cation diffusion facilitator CzcD-associated flavoprotein CzcO